MASCSRGGSPMTLSFGNLSFGAGHSGSAPEPFNAIDGGRLAGGEGSHPLHDVAIDELVQAGDGPIAGTFVLDRPVVVGETITGTLTIQAQERVEARGAMLRLVGLRLDEERKSVEHRDSKGNVTSSENWVECHGRLFIEDPYMEPAIPAVLEAGASWQGRFGIPAPALGPPTAHLGESIIAWALEVPLGHPPRLGPLRGDPRAGRPASRPPAGRRRPAGRGQPARCRVDRRRAHRGDIAVARPGRQRDPRRRALAVGAEGQWRPGGAPPADERPERAQRGSWPRSRSTPPRSPAGCRASRWPCRRARRPRSTGPASRSTT